MLRGAGLAALLTGCTLITDPSSFEGGDPPDMRADAATPDMGRPDAGGDTGMRELTELRIDPERIVIAIGQAEQFAVVARFSDGSTDDVTDIASLDVLNEGVVSRDGDRLTALAPGRSLLRATLDSVSVEAPVEVNLGGLAVYTDDFEAGFDRAFFAAAAEDLTPVNDSFLGERALRVGVPGEGFAGFTVIAETAQDLSAFNAMTAWVRGTGADQVLDVIGLGLDLDTNRRSVETAVGIPLGREWQLIVIPLPDPVRYGEERGLFHVAEGASGEPTSFLLDEIRFVRFPEGELEVRSVNFPTGVLPLPIGEVVPLPLGSLTVRAFERELRLDIGAGVFATRSSAPGIVAIPEDGFAIGSRVGSAMLTGTLRGAPAEGTLTAVVAEAGPPSVPAPRPPPRPDADVIGIYTDAYPLAEVDTLATDFSALTSDEERVLAPGDSAIRYEGVDFVAIETVVEPVNTTGMTHIHFDIWVEDPIPLGLSFKLVDFGPNGVFDGLGLGDDSEAEFRYDRTASESPPRLAGGRWIAFDIALRDFERGGTFDVGPGLEERENIAQYIFGRGPSRTPVTFWMDNLYFYR